MTYSEIFAAGLSNTSFKDVEPTTDDCPLISFTSGTTGIPKGVKVSHKMLITCTSGCVDSMEGCMMNGDSFLSYLPYAHIYENLSWTMAIVYGLKFGYYCGDPLRMIREDIPALQPTMFNSVPRVFNKLYGIIEEKLKEMTGCKRWLVEKAIRTKL